eukprot:NODE_14272_length_423_cov_1.733108_g14249_i0.p2 GENE.NODE_14272_length_423_cov_1.733108_g14249_i0~~NODE_14272_length_423_cov_1.733108_g14249_i0.p2  ORF type:complete len:102 (+),score=6.93 NODE_14272_length_423_cov_1.733108_g14249_i0:117-422(+)
MPWAAGLWSEATGFDPAADLRGAYDTAFGGRRIVMARGGLLRLAQDCMAGIEAGGDGDGVCIASAQGQTLAGIMSGGRLWLKVDRGAIAPRKFTILDRWCY